MAEASVPTNIHTEAENNAPVMVDVQHVTMSFNMASERLNNLKEYAIALARHELQFKEFKALDDITFQVHKGEVFGILGTNGSGKSTLLKIVAGVLDPSKGSCTVNGSIAPLIELGAGFDMELTARENIYLNGALLGYSRAFINEHFEEIVDFAEVHDFLDMPMKNYSSGMVARVAFAIATAIVPEILIVDEVLSVGDFMFQQKCEKRIMSLIKDHGVTVLIVSHNNDQIERLCTRAVWIEKGQMRVAGDTRKVCGLYRVLGGHIGSKDSEEALSKIFLSNKPAPKRRASTITAADRCAMAANLACAMPSMNTGKTVVVADGNQPQVCLAANSLAALYETPLLLTQEIQLPRTAAFALEQLRPSRILLVATGDSVGKAVDGQIQELCSCPVQRIGGDSLDETALQVFEHAKGEGYAWGTQAVLTHEDCMADHIAIEPFAYAHKAPVFFSKGGGIIGEQTMRRLTGSIFENVLVIGGGYVDFPEESLAPLDKAGVPYRRFFADGGYEASALIADWTLERDSRFSLRTLLISSLWSPEDGFAIGAHAASTGSVVLLEDPQDMDSVVHAMRYVSAHNKQIKQLCFLDSGNKYSDLDKEMLAKALTEQASEPDDDLGKIPEGAPAQ